MNKIDALESSIVAIAVKIAPLAAPIPTAYLVGRSTVEYLAWPVVVGVIAALIIEALGLSATSTALMLYQYNSGKRKSDPHAPFWLAALLVGVYFIVATGLTVLLDIVPVMAAYAPAIFPTLSLVGVTIAALQYDHKRRLVEIENVKQERKERRQSRRKAAVKESPSNTSSNGKFDTDLSKLQQGKKDNMDSRIDKLLDAYLDNSDLTVTGAAKLIDVSRQTIYNYLDQLEQAGRIRRNGKGVEILS